MWLDEIEETTAHVIKNAASTNHKLGIANVANKGMILSLGDNDACNRDRTEMTFARRWGKSENEKGRPLLYISLKYRQGGQKIRKQILEFLNIFFWSTLMYY